MVTFNSPWLGMGSRGIECIRELLQPSSVRMQLTCNTNVCQSSIQLKISRLGDEGGGGGGG